VLSFSTGIFRPRALSFSTGVYKQVWDLYELGGEDRLEAAERLIDRTLR
jgi:hypothetical protein